MDRTAQTHTHAHTLTRDLSVTMCIWPQVKCETMDTDMTLTLTRGPPLGANRDALRHAKAMSKDKLLSKPLSEVRGRVWVGLCGVERVCVHGSHFSM